MRWTGDGGCQRRGAAAAHRPDPAVGGQPLSATIVTSSDTTNSASAETTTSTQNVTGRPWWAGTGGGGAVGRTGHCCCGPLTWDTPGWPCGCHVGPVVPGAPVPTMLPGVDPGRLCGDIPAAAGVPWA